jgi:hypothetical protein
MKLIPSIQTSSVNSYNAEIACMYVFAYTKRLDKHNVTSTKHGILNSLRKGRDFVR